MAMMTSGHARSEKRWLHVATRATSVAGGVTIIVAWAVDASPMTTGEGWLARSLTLAAISALWVATAHWQWGPVPVLLVTACGVAWLNIDRLVGSRSGGPSLVVLLLIVWWVCLRHGLIASILAVALGLATALTYLVDADVASLAGMAVVTVLGAVACRAFRAQQESLTLLRCAQEELAANAVEQERSRIAQEVHDIAAHTLAVTMLHITGARLLARRTGADPRVNAALEEAEEAGRESMAELRRAVTLLGPDALTNGLAPVPDATGIHDLVETYVRAGLDVHLSMTGEMERLPPLIALAVYRVIQESLANVVRHAPGSTAEVLVAIGGDCTITVRDNGPGCSQPSLPTGLAGRGIAGMRARVAAVGGYIEVGPHDSGWVVHALLPLHANGRSRGAA